MGSLYFDGEHGGVSPVPERGVGCPRGTLCWVGGMDGGGSQCQVWGGRAVCLSDWGILGHSGGGWVTFWRRVQGGLYTWMGDPGGPCSTLGGVPLPLTGGTQSDISVCLSEPWGGSGPDAPPPHGAPTPPNPLTQFLGRGRILLCIHEAKPHSFVLQHLRCQLGGGTTPRGHHHPHCDPPTPFKSCPHSG